MKLYVASDKSHGRVWRPRDAEASLAPTSWPKIRTRLPQINGRRKWIRSSRWKSGPSKAQRPLGSECCMEGKIDAQRAWLMIGEMNRP
jgi:hypothetical protein